MRGRVLRMALSASCLLVAAGCTSAGTAIGWRVFDDEGMGAREFRVRHLADERFVTTDGTELSSEVYLPVGAGRVPTILVRLPMPVWWKNQVKLNVIGDAWAARGYAVVFQGTWGTRSSRKRPKSS